MDLKNDRVKLLGLANLMNEQSETPIIVTDDLAYVFDPVLEPAAEHLIRRGIARRITKEEAILFINDAEEKGAVHLIPSEREVFLPILEGSQRRISQ